MFIVWRVVPRMKTYVEENFKGFPSMLFFDLRWKYDFFLNYNYFMKKFRSDFIFRKKKKLIIEWQRKGVEERERVKWTDNNIFSLQYLFWRTWKYHPLSLYDSIFYIVCGWKSKWIVICNNSIYSLIFRLFPDVAYIWNPFNTFVHSSSMSSITKTLLQQNMFTF